MNDTPDAVADGAPADADAPLREAKTVRLVVDTHFSVEADGSRKRILAKPIRGHNGATVAEVLLRRPRYREIMDYGDPTLLVHLEGGVLPQYDMQVIENYVRALVQNIEPGLLEQCDYTDALAFKEAVLSFFRTTTLRVG